MPAPNQIDHVPDDRITHQPAARMNHPAWVFSHLNLYHPVMLALLRGHDPSSASTQMKENLMPPARPRHLPQSLLPLTPVVVLATPDEADAPVTAKKTTAKAGKK